MTPALTSDHPRFALQRHSSTTPALPAAQIVAFCQYPGGGSDALILWLMEQGARITTVPLSHLPLDWFDHYAHSYDVALIDSGFLGDDGQVIDFGLRLRRFAPDLPIIMLSARIAASDFSTERMAICDVTLKAPVPPAELIEALATALENHAYWRDTRLQSRLTLTRKAPSPPAV